MPTPLEIIVEATDKASPVINVYGNQNTADIMARAMVEAARQAARQAALRAAFGV